MTKEIPIVDYKKCVACGSCVQACPYSALELNKTDVDKYKKSYPILSVPGDCTGCALCQKACPMECIVMDSNLKTKGFYREKGTR